MNNNEPPQKKPKKLGKTSIFNTFETIPKTNLLILKPQKSKPQKTPFCHVQKQPTIFHKFSDFSTYSFCFWKTVFCWKHYKNSVFRKHSFSKTQLVKPTFSTMSKNTFFKEKVSFLVLFNFRWNPYFYSFSCFTLFWSKKQIWPKQIVATKMRFFFSLPDTNSVRQFSLKIHFLWSLTFLDDHLKKTYFYRVFFCYFPFFCFFLFSVSIFQHKKEKNKKCNFLFENLIFDNPKFCKNTILTHCDTICVTKKAKNTRKLGENSKKKLGPVFNL